MKAQSPDLVKKQQAEVLANGKLKMKWVMEEERYKVLTVTEIKIVEAIGIFFPACFVLYTLFIY